MKVNREELLKELEIVFPGLATREIVEQSSCFIFKDKMVMTYNDEIACRFPSCLNIKGAIPAMPLIEILRRLKEETLEVEVKGGELTFRGRRKQTGITMEEKIELPIETVETPRQWTKLPKGFTEAVAIVQECAGKEQAQFSMTCVHITPKWLEACDNYQGTRFKIKTKISKSTLVRRDSLKHIIELGMTELSETKTWVHFRNTLGLIMSCRRWKEDFPDISKLLKVKGSPIVLPKGLRDAADRAEVFSAENTEEDNYVTIDLQKNKLRLKGLGISGWYKETKTVEYSGQNISFTISPNLLTELVKKHNKCEISKRRLKVDGGKFIYVTVLGRAKKKKGKGSGKEKSKGKRQKTSC